MTTSTTTEVPWIRSGLLSEHGFALHGFTMRHGAGVSAGDFASWNFSTSTGDAVDKVEENYRILADVLQVSRDAIWSVHQVHSNRVVEIEEHSPKVTHEKADGLLSWSPDAVIAVKTADCIPVLLADPVSRVVGAVHAGWRGVAGGIVLRAVQQLRARHPEAQPVMAIGPHICADCFQVGPEVAAEFPGHAREDQTRTGHYLVDLVGVLREQMARVGVLSQHIDVTGHCTLCDPRHRFFSHRRSGGRCGRMINFISARPCSVGLLPWPMIS